MPTVRVNIKVSADEPVPESLGSTFITEASSVIEVYRLLRSHILALSKTPPITDPDADTAH